jgi:hypothetical protein
MGYAPAPSAAVYVDKQDGEECFVTETDIVGQIKLCLIGW